MNNDEVFQQLQVEEKLLKDTADIILSNVDKATNEKKRVYSYDINEKFVDGDGGLTDLGIELKHMIVEKGLGFEIDKRSKYSFSVVIRW